MRGRHIMMGYVNREDANKKVRGRWRTQAEIFATFEK
jgi:hypothetical protein